MTVEMHGVGGRCRIVDYNTNGCVGAEVEDVSDWIEGEVSLLSLAQDRLIVVCAKGRATQCPLEGASSINKEVDFLEHSCRGCCGVQGIYRDGG